MTPRVRQYAVEAEQAHKAPAGSVFTRSRVAPVARARQAVMRRLHADGFSATQIGRWLNRDHTTVLHALRVTG